MFKDLIIYAIGVVLNDKELIILLLIFGLLLYIIRFKIELLKLQIEDSEQILPKRFITRTQLSTVYLLCPERKEAISIGYFIGSTNRAVTSLNVLSNYYQLSDYSVRIKGTIHKRQRDGSIKVVNVELNYLNGNTKNNIAILTLNNSMAADACLQMPNINSNLESNQKLVIIAYTNTSRRIHTHNNINHNNICILPAYYYKSSAYHLAYSSILFSGNCSGALVLTTDGIVRAIHTHTVNQAREAIRHQGRIGSNDKDEVVDSLNDLTSCMSQGFIGLRLDSRDIQSTIMK